MALSQTHNHRIQQLRPYDAREHVWQIETPRGSRNKYTFDPSLGLFMLGGILPEGMSFPYDFGFLPATLADDGDPIDVLLLMDEPAFCGCVVPARLIGVIEARQTERDGTTERNDRLIAVPVEARTLSDCRSVKDLNDRRLKEIEEFFVSYNRVRGKRFKVIAIHAGKRAERLAHDGEAAYRKRHRSHAGGKNGAKK